MTALAGLAGSSGAMIFATEVLHWPAYIGAGASCLVIPILSYFVFMSWVFVEEHRSPTDNAPTEASENRE